MRAQVAQRALQGVVLHAASPVVARGLGVQVAGKARAGQAQQLQQDAADAGRRAQRTRLVVRHQGIEPMANLREILGPEGEVQGLLEQEGCQLRVLRHAHVLQVQGGHVELGPEEALVEVDDGVARACRVRHHVHAVGQHKAQRARAKGPCGRAHHLPIAPFEAHLDLEILVPVRAAEHVARPLEADVEIQVLGALLHSVQACMGVRSGRGGHAQMVSARAVVALSGLGVDAYKLPVMAAPTIAIDHNKSG